MQPNSSGRRRNKRSKFGDETAPSTNQLVQLPPPAPVNKSQHHQKISPKPQMANQQQNGKRRNPPVKDSSSSSDDEQGSSSTIVTAPVTSIGKSSTTKPQLKQQSQPQMKQQNKTQPNTTATAQKQKADWLSSASIVAAADTSSESETESEEENDSEQQNDNQVFNDDSDSEQKLDQNSLDSDELPEDIFEGDYEGEINLDEWEGEGILDEEYLRMLAEGTDSDEDDEDEESEESEEPSEDEVQAVDEGSESDGGYEIDTTFKQNLSNMAFADVLSVIRQSLVVPKTAKTVKTTKPTNKDPAPSQQKSKVDQVKLLMDMIDKQDKKNEKNGQNGQNDQNDQNDDSEGEGEGELDGFDFDFGEGEGEFDFNLFGEGEEGEGDEFGQMDDEDDQNEDDSEEDDNGSDSDTMNDKPTPKQKQSQSNALKQNSTAKDQRNGQNDSKKSQNGQNVPQNGHHNLHPTLNNLPPNPFIVPVHRKPDIHLSRLQLPVCAQEAEIMDIVNHNDIAILSGETGSGKTTQLPQFLYEAGYCRDGIIGITQPRRVAAISAANRVQDELNMAPKRIVGHQIRFENNCTKDTVIKMMTEGILLREIQTDFLLSRYSCIIIDEAHERGLNTDILLGLLSRIIPLRNQIITLCHRLIQTGLLPPPPPLAQLNGEQPTLQAPEELNTNEDSTFYDRLDAKNKAFFDAVLKECMSNTTNSEEVIMGFTPKRLRYLPFDQLARKFALNGISKGKLKIVIMSATLRVTDFTQNYKLFPLPPPVYTVNSRQYPVDLHFSRVTPIDYVEKCLQKVARVHARLPAGAILVFLTGREEIEAFCTKLRSLFPAPVPGEDNSITMHNTGLGAGRLYLKALKMVKQSLIENNISVDFGTETTPAQADTSVVTKAGQTVVAGADAFAKKIDVAAQQKRRWDLINFDSLTPTPTATATTATPSSQTHSIDATDTKGGDKHGNNKKESKSGKLEKLKEPQTKNPDDVINGRMLKYLISRQVVVIKDAQAKNRLVRLQGRDTKATRGAAFSMDEISQYEEGEKKKEKEKEVVEEDLELVKPVDVVAELAKFRQRQKVLAEKLKEKEKRQKQKALQKGSAMCDGDDAAAEEEVDDEDDELEGDGDEDDEALYELSDDDDYDDENDTENDPNNPKSDPNRDPDDEALDPIEDATQTTLEKEQKESQQSQERQKKRWEEEMEQLKTNSPIPLLVLPLYAMLPTSEQMKVFHWEKYSHGARVVIVSTNMAETSVTIPNIKYVVDSGREKVKNVEIQTGATNFSIGFIPQSSAGQRAGRAGRTGPGHAYRIFSGAVFNDHFPLHSTPEILKQPFENTLLQMKSIGIHDITRFPFPTPPLYSTVKAAGYVLYVIGAMQTKQEKLFEERKQLALQNARNSSGMSQNSLMDRHQYIQHKRMAESNDTPFHLEQRTKWQAHHQFQINKKQQADSNQPSQSQNLTAGMTKLQRKQFMKQQEEEQSQKELLAQQQALIDTALQSIESVRIPTAGGTQFSSLMDLDITQLGETMAFFPLHPRFSKVILTCANQPLGTLSYGIALTSVMTIQEIQIQPRFVVEYEMAAKKAREKQRLKGKKGQQKGGSKSTESVDFDESDQDDDEIDITAFDSDDEEDAKSSAMGDREEGPMRGQKAIDVEGSKIHDDMAALIETQQAKKAAKIQKAKAAQKEAERKRKEWLQEQYDLYRSKCDQFLVPESDLFTKLNIFGAYLFTRQSTVKAAWKAHSKALHQQYKDELVAGKIKQHHYEDLCWKFNLAPVKELSLNPLISKRFSTIPQVSQTYSQLPAKARGAVDKKLELWCRQHYVRAKGLADCYKLFQQVQKIVVSYLESKLKTLGSGASTFETKANIDGEQDSEFGIADIKLGDQDDEEYGEKSSEDQNDQSGQNDKNAQNVNAPAKKSKILTPQDKLKADRLSLLLSNLSLFTECIPPPSTTTYSLLQQVILASFADKIAWKMNDERKQQFIDRSTVQKSILTNPSQPLPHPSLLGDPISLIPRPRNYTEPSRLKISMIQQRFSRLPGGLESAEYKQQLDEAMAAVPLSKNDLTNAYEILESGEPMFISPQSIVYKKQHGFMNKIRDAKKSQNGGNVGGSAGTMPITTQTLQQMASARKLTSSLVGQIQLEMDSELQFVLFGDIVQDQGKYKMSFLNDCTLLNESWLPVICNQLCSINSYLDSPMPFMKQLGNGNRDDDADDKGRNEKNEKNASTLSKLAQAKVSNHNSSSAASASSIANPIESELQRYCDITYGHKRWPLKPHPVPYLPTVISLLPSTPGASSSGIRQEDLTPNTGSVQLYHQFLAKYILDGTLFPFLRPLIPLYSHAPSICLESKLREPALQLVQCLAHHNIYSVQDLYDVWYGKETTALVETGSAFGVKGKGNGVSKNPRFLKQELMLFITNKQHRAVLEQAWPPAKP